MSDYKENITENKLQLEIIRQLEEKGWQVREHIQRLNEKEVIDKEVLFSILQKINKNIKPDLIKTAIDELLNVRDSSLVRENKQIHNWLIKGMTIEDKDNIKFNPNINFIDFKNIDNNTFELCQEFNVSNGEEKKRLDIVLFINGIPMIIFELKSPSNKKVGIEEAFNQIQTYKNKLDDLYKYNALNIISDGHNALYGTITSVFDRYSIWKKESLDGEVKNDEVFKINTLIKGMLNKETILDLIKNFVIFNDDDQKIIAAYHQYYGMKRAIESVCKTKDGKGGIVWHTQGSGKSYSMIFLTKGLIDRLNNPTIVVITDRIDLDSQLFTTFSKSKDFLKSVPKQIESRKGLIEELKKVTIGGIFFTTIQKFTEDTGLLSNREDIIVIADEAHRSHDINMVRFKIDKTFETIEESHSYSKYIKEALPKARLIGFTGTPINNKEKQTIDTFGEVVDVYDMKQSVEDGSTVPIKYEQILVKVDLIEKSLNKIQNYIEEQKNNESPELVDEATKDVLSISAIIGDKQRLEEIVNIFIEHYYSRVDQLHGKAMYVAYNRNIAFRIYKHILEKKPELKDKVKLVITTNNQDSKEMSEAIGTKEEKVKTINDFKKPDSEIKILIVVDMLLTGYDVPSLDVMYIDKPLRMHNLMQAIARVNRKFPSKDAGLIVDFIGLGVYLDEAVSHYTKNNTKRETTIETTEDVVDRIRDLLEMLDNIIKGFDYQEYFNNESKDYKIVTDMLEYIHQKDIGVLDDEKKLWTRFKKLSKELFIGYKYSKFAIKDQNLKAKITLFLSVWTLGVKSLYAPTINPSGYKNIKKQLMRLMEEAIFGKEIVTIENIGKETEIELFSDETIEAMKENYKPATLNLILTEWLDKEITFLGKKNIVKAKEFREKLKKLVENYNKVSDYKALSGEIIKLAKECVTYKKEGKDLGMDENEYAMYDIISRPEGVKDNFDKEMLITFAKELLLVMGNNKTVDWYKRETVKATMRMELKKLAKKYNYPPEDIKENMNDIFSQSENIIDDVDETDKTN